MLDFISGSIYDPIFLLHSTDNDHLKRMKNIDLAKHDPANHAADLIAGHSAYAAA